jgi:hypothetical protein
VRIVTNATDVMTRFRMPKLSLSVHFTLTGASTGLLDSAVEQSIDSERNVGPH